jgi:hypothetical protein
MLEFAMAHPYITAFLAYLVLHYFCNMVVGVFKYLAIAVKGYDKKENKTLMEEEIK